MGLDADIYIRVQPNASMEAVQLITGAVLAGELFGYKIHQFDWDNYGYRFDPAMKEDGNLYFEVDLNGSRYYGLGYERGINWTQMYKFMCLCMESGLEIQYSADYEGDTFQPTKRSLIDFFNRIYEKHGRRRYGIGERPTEEEYKEYDRCF